MDCKDFEKLIPKFIKKECTPKEAEILLEHIRTCPECKEEVTIQLLLEEGLNRLESGDSFDLNAEFNKLVAEGGQRKKERRRLLSQEQVVVIVDIIGGAIIVGVIIALLGWNIH